MFKRKTTRTLAGLSGTALLAVSAWTFAQAINDQAPEPVEPYPIQAPTPDQPLNAQPVDLQAQDPEPMPGSTPTDVVPAPLLVPSTEPVVPAEPAVAVPEPTVVVIAEPPTESEKLDRYEAMDSNKDGVLSRRELMLGVLDDGSVNRIALERQLARTDGQPQSYSVPIATTR